MRDRRQAVRVALIVLDALDAIDRARPEIVGDDEPRNSGMTFRPVGERAEPYPDWVRNLRGKSGVYIIRDRKTHEVLYVGESHSARLHATLTRHFQTWRRWKGYWRGQYGEGHDPGLTYERDRVEVAVRITAASRALDTEARFIRRLQPRDNLLGQPEEEAVPF
ncbi:MAG: GIY-YIG nuclease family protein [Myxococcales bacterium]|nr:GIY-YIG nuclease family protein [Myxococcales bacterium]